MRVKMRYLYYTFLFVVGYATFVSLLNHFLGGFSTFFRSKRMNSISNIQDNGNLSEVGVFTKPTKTDKPLVLVTAEEFQKKIGLLTGNPLIDEYGKNDMGRAGENGRGVTFTGKEKQIVDTHMDRLYINVLASDIIPLNRIVPDSRPPGCSDLQYPINDLPTASIIVPCYNEWPSILLRTVYSIINRSPRNLIKEIVLVDDASDTELFSHAGVTSTTALDYISPVGLENLETSSREGVKAPLDKYINDNFPKGLVKLIHLKQRVGLIKGRLSGWKNTTGDVVIFFDCHMEVNIDWLPPLLMVVKKDRRTVAMSALDSIQAESFEYQFSEDIIPGYGFDWKLGVFEKGWRKQQTEGKSPTDPLEGTVMIGAAFAIDSKNFTEIGTYDEGMNVWGGENLEMSWRVWMCGGRLIHVPCSHIGHIARSQPYSFPGGRAQVEAHNYKRAIEVWMPDNCRKIVYDSHKNMAEMDVGDLSERIKLKERLKCKDFYWYIDNISPELNVLDRDALAWGTVHNPSSGLCLDTNNHLWSTHANLWAKPCQSANKYTIQGFNLDKGHRLRSSLQCVCMISGYVGVKLLGCVGEPEDLWIHQKDGPIVHQKTGKCLELTTENLPVINTCIQNSEAQKWTFENYVA